MLTFFLAICTQLATAQCFLERPVIIAPERSTDIVIEVEGLAIDDLSNGQALCAVYMEWEHGKQENLRMSLISPAGQEVTLAGPGIQFGNLSPNVNWNVGFIPCAQPPSPDPGLPAVWDNAQPWQFLGKYTGSYYPNNGCLEDFNTGSANGPWRLQITNLGNTSGVLIFTELQFCNDTGIACDYCSTYAGQWDFQIVPVCEGGAGLIALEENFLLEPELDNDDAYIYSIERPDGKFYTTASLQADTFSVGTYIICGVAYDESATAVVESASSNEELELLTTNGACVDVTDFCLELRIQRPSIVMDIDRNICIGDSIIIRDELYYTETDTLFYSSANPFMPCDTAWQISVQEVRLTASILDQNNPVVCGQNLFLDGSASATNVGQISSYTWTTTDGNIISGVGPIAQINQQGTYYLDISDGACNAYDTIQVMGVDTFYVTLEQAAALCAEDPLIINFIDSIDLATGPVSWGIAGSCGPNTGITINATNPPTIEVAFPGEYIIKTAAGSCAQNDTIVISAAGMAIPFSVTVEDTLGCDMEPVYFNFITDIIPTNIFYDGPQLIAANEINPAITEPGFYTITIYDDNNCSAEAVVEVITQDAAPVVQLSDINRACDDDSSVLLTADIVGATNDLYWTGPDGMTYDQLEPIVTDTGTYTLTVIGANGCISDNNTLHYTITNDTIPWANLELVAELACMGDSAELFLPQIVIDEAIGISWVGEDEMVIGTENSQFFAEAGNYGVIIESPLSCRRLIPILIEQHPEWNILDGIELTTVQTECDSLGELHLDGDLSTISSIYINGMNTELSTILKVPYNNFELQLESNQGCLRDTVLKIRNLESPVVDLGPDITLNLGESYAIPVDPSILQNDWTIEWLDDSNLSCSDCLNPTVTPSLTTTLTVVITNSDGCSTEDALVITVFEDSEEGFLELGYYLPNVLFLESLSPEATLIMGVDKNNFILYEFYIYDRWGGQMLAKQGPVETSSIELWDGSIQGRYVNSGVYTYMAKLLHISGKEQLISGQISILR